MSSYFFKVMITYDNREAATARAFHLLFSPVHDVVWFHVMPDLNAMKGATIQSDTIVLVSFVLVSSLRFLSGMRHTKKVAYVYSAYYRVP